MHLSNSPGQISSLVCIYCVVKAVAKKMIKQGLSVHIIFLSLSGVYQLC